jgi:hypothetical protein
MTTRRLEVFHSTLTRLGWVVRGGGETLSRHRNQTEAETAACLASRKAVSNGAIAQAVSHKMDGTVRARRSFGHDGERRPD